jgi:hypothetical protein
VIASKCLDGSLQAKSRLGIVELDTPRAFTRLVEFALGDGASSTALVESAGDAAHLVALAPTDLEQFVVPTLDGVPMAIDKIVETPERYQRPLDGRATFGGLGSSLGIGGETSLGLVEPSFQEHLAFVEAGVADLVVMGSGWFML